jgi:hypothetical protein
MDKSGRFTLRRAGNEMYKDDLIRYHERRFILNHRLGRQRGRFDGSLASADQTGQSEIVSILTHAIRYHLVTKFTHSLPSNKSL